MTAPEFSTVITVFLSTGKFCPGDDIMQRTNAPICVVHMDLDRFGSITNSERYQMAETLKAMAKIVEIDPNNRTVIIRDDRPNGILVSYSAGPIGKSNFHDEFFKRWVEIRMLLFEFQIYLNLKKSNCLFVCKGLYDLDHWHHLDIQSAPTLFLEDTNIEKGSTNIFTDPFAGGGSLGG